MYKRTVKLYCDRCKKEISESSIYHQIFDSKNLHIKFQRLKFTCIPRRWKKDANIGNYYVDENKELDLCSQCAKEFVEWWEGGSN